MDQNNPTNPGGFGNTTGSDLGTGTGAGGTGTTGAGTGATGSGGSMGGGTGSSGGYGSGSTGGGSGSGGYGGGSTGGGSGTGSGGYGGGGDIGGGSGGSMSAGGGGTGTDNTCPTCGQTRGRGLEQFLGRLGITDEMVGNLKSQFQNVDIDEYMNTAREYLKDGSTKATSYAKDNPGKVAAGVAALALGAGLIYAAANRDRSDDRSNT